MSKRVEQAILLLIVLNLIALVVETIDPLYKGSEYYFQAFEVFSLAIFSIEYLVRLRSGRLKYALSLLGILDLLAIAPLFLVFVKADLRLVRALRLVRLARVFKLARYTEAMDRLLSVLKLKREELVVTTGFMLVLLFIGSVLMFELEHEAQPDKFPDALSSMWWAVATMTTVGYGDVVPITAGGRMVGSLVAILGVGFFALPAGILGAGLVEQTQKHKTRKDSASH